MVPLEKQGGAGVTDLPEQEKEQQPEKQDERKPDREEILEEIRERKSSSFWKGVLAGSLCMLLFCGVYLLILVGISRQNSRNSSENRGAEALTDSDTLKKLSEIEGLLNSYYLGEMEGEELTAYLFRGIAAGLGDAYARYYTKEELNSALDDTKGAYYGIGATLSQDTATGEIRAVQIYENSPADKAGLKPGDLLLSCAGESLEGMELSQAVERIKSQEGEFLLVVSREDAGEVTLTMQCENVEKVTVHTRMLEAEIGYMEILEFDRVTVEQFREGLSELQAQGMKKLVVDLRDNPGGLLESVCEILDDLLPEGLIVYTQDKSGDRVDYTSQEGRLFEGELAVLVNENTASAAEIFAGAVQDHGIGKVIGTQTYGKGLVQKTFTLSDGSGIKFTTENYFTPLGNNINGTGITPDLPVEETKKEDAVLDAALSVLGEEPL